LGRGQIAEKKAGIWVRKKLELERPLQEKVLRYFSNKRGGGGGGKKKGGVRQNIGKKGSSAKPKKEKKSSEEQANWPSKKKGSEPW